MNRLKLTYLNQQFLRRARDSVRKRPSNANAIRNMYALTSIWVGSLSKAWHIANFANSRFFDI